MADKNGYNSSDFKRNTNQDMQVDDAEQHEQDGDEPKINDKAGEYMRELLSEKIKLNTAKFPFATKLIDQEVTKVQASGRVPPRDNKYADVYHEKPVKVTVKVLVPIKEHPKFNFVGKLLGPKGSTMKQLQDETMCKMAVLGRGSMRDRQKEEELRNSLDPKYAHLTDELHVEISSIAPPAEAHARIAYALAEVKKYLLPDVNDMIRHDQMREINHQRGPPGRPGPPRMPRQHQQPPRGPHMARAMPPKAKVISILDRARSAMESSYGYDDPYAAPEPPVRGPPRSAPPPEDFYYSGGHERYYEDDSYYKEEPREFKSSRDVGTRRPQQRYQQHQHQRPSPYARPQK